MLQVFIVRWALTKGIFEASAEQVKDDCAHVMARWGGMEFFREGQWAPTLAEAEALAAEMARRRVKSLERALVKMRAFKPKVAGTWGAPKRQRGGGSE